MRRMAMSKLTNVPSRHTGAPRFAGGSGGVDTTVKTYSLSDEEKESFSKKTAEYYISLKEKGLTDKDAAEDMGINVVKLNQLKTNWGFIGKKLDQMKTVLKQHKRKQGQKFDHRGSKEKAERGLENSKVKVDSEKEVTHQAANSEDDLKTKIKKLEDENHSLKQYSSSLSDEKKDIEKRLERAVSKEEYQRLEKERMDLLDKLNHLRDKQETTEMKDSSQEEVDYLKKIKVELQNTQNELEQERFKSEAKSEQIQDYEEQINDLQNSLLRESQKHFALSQYMILTMQEL